MNDSGKQNTGGPSPGPPVSVYTIRSAVPVVREDLRAVGGDQGLSDLLGQLVPLDRPGAPVGQRQADAARAADRQFRGLLIRGEPDVLRLGPLDRRPTLHDQDGVRGPVEELDELAALV